MMNLLWVMFIIFSNLNMIFSLMVVSVRMESM